MHKALKKLKAITFPLIIHLGKKVEQKHFQKEPIVIGGCARSGTTLLLSILAAHPAIYAIKKEIRVFKNWREHHTPQGKIETPTRIDRLYRDFLFHHIPHGVTRWIEKDTINVRVFDRISNYYQGKVKLINIIRDGRDVMTSVHPKDPNRFWVDPPRWCYDIKMGIKFSALPNVFTVKYEDLILEFPDTIRRLLEFIGEDYHPDLENWHRKTSVDKHDGWFDSVQKIHSRSIGKWKRPEYQARLEEIMQHQETVELLKKFNYI